VLCRGLTAIERDHAAKELSKTKSWAGARPEINPTLSVGLKAESGLSRIECHRARLHSKKKCETNVWAGEGPETTLAPLEENTWHALLRHVSTRYTIYTQKQLLHLQRDL